MKQFKLLILCTSLLIFGTLAGFIAARILCYVFGIPDFYFSSIAFIAGFAITGAGFIPLEAKYLYTVYPTQYGQRLIYENAVNLATKLGYTIGDSVPTQSYLRSEVLLSASSSNYHLPILVNDMQNGAVRVNEKRLNLQDIFVTSEISVMLQVGNTAASKLYPYPDVTIFTSATDDDAYAIYNGMLQLTVNNKQVMPAWDILRHLRVPVIQSLAVLYYASSPTQLNDNDFGVHTFYPVEPNILMNGAGNIQFNMVLPAAPATVLSTSAVAVIQRGILLQNVTQVK